MDKDKLIRRKKYFPVAIGAGILIIMILFMITGLTHNLGLIFPLFIAFPAYAIGMGIYYDRKILRPFKEEIIKSKLVKSIPGIKYEYLPNLSEIEIMCKSMYLIPRATSYKFTDMITDLNYSYVYKSIDLHATHKSGGKNNTTHTDFLGKVYIVDDFNYGCEFILLDNDYFNRFTLNYFNRQNPYYNEVTINNDEFTTNYRLFSKDQNIAYDIFNLGLIMNLNKLKYKTNGKLIINYYQSKLYVFIYNQENQFEEEPDVISDYKKQIENLDSIVQILENNMDGKEAN
jgi:hypothetical protein